MLEKEFESKMTDIVKSLGGLCLKFESPGNTGVPDRLVIGTHGNIYFVDEINIIIHPNKIIWDSGVVDYSLKFVSNIYRSEWFAFGNDVDIINACKTWFIANDYKNRIALKVFLYALDWAFQF